MSGGGPPFSGAGMRGPGSFTPGIRGGSWRGISPFGVNSSSTRRGGGGERAHILPMGGTREQIGLSMVCGCNRSASHGPVVTFFTQEDSQWIRGVLATLGSDHMTLDEFHSVGMVTVGPSIEARFSRALEAIDIQVSRRSAFSTPDTSSALHSPFGQNSDSDSDDGGMFGPPPSMGYPGMGYPGIGFPSMGNMGRSRGRRGRRFS
ncbi:hypothetical protein BCR34DRAFT_593802 [Clohesyomyces aquaticus]|uniref:Uncharacterized protein n=1 Tax=Clohesyomyces aquaticus TaxID=1231657 RepID=A0A1Y1YF40_9PLEO|nr:hypothetical protein BCR34DRAFT_593802 [Clohesyomyces aquaticus]